MPCGIFPPISFMLLPRAQCSRRPMGCFRRRMHGFCRQIRRICCGSVPLLLRRKRTSAAGGTHRRFPGAAPLSGHDASAVRYGIPVAGMMLLPPTWHRFFPSCAGTPACRFLCVGCSAAPSGCALPPAEQVVRRRVILCSAARSAWRPDWQTVCPCASGSAAVLGFYEKFLSRMN